MIYNCGGPDRSIKLEDLQRGVAVSTCYRNRRLGDFLKEMGLSEGRSTGLSLIYAELARNESPKPLIETDDERSFFRLTLFIQPLFERFSEEVKEPEPGLYLFARRLAPFITSSDQVGDLVKKMTILLLRVSDGALGREELLREINLSNHTKNVRRYISPLERAGLIEKTLPNIPTSLCQKYQITPKGRAILTSKS